MEFNINDDDTEDLWTNCQFGVLKNNSERIFNEANKREYEAN